MGILSLISCKTTHPKNLSEQLDEIGYFDLIENNQKKKFVKEKIDFEFRNDENPYIGKEWFIIPNDGYISSVYNIAEYENKSSTSDFRAFEIWGGGLLSGEFESTLESAQVVFEKNGLKLYWKDEKFQQTNNDISHSIIINDKLYEVFTGTLSRDNIGEITYQYISRLKEILNDAIANQNKEYRVILLTQPETVYFVLFSNNELDQFKKIIEKCKNKIEE
jgi:hypothetical protein